jgi:hypothetical protein
VGGHRALAWAVAVAGICLAGSAEPRASGDPGFRVTDGRHGIRQAIISGEVRRTSATGEVAPSVDVWAADAATGAEVGRNQTDGSGRFTMAVPAGRYTISAVRPGYLRSDYGSARYGLPGSPIDIAPGQHEQIQIVIHRGAVVTGVVRSETGASIASAIVEMWRPSMTTGLQREFVSRATTDANGIYRVEGLPPGAYLMVAMMSYRTTPGNAPKRVRAPAAQFFPATEAESQADRVTVEADEERTGVDFMLPRRSLTMLTVVLTARDNVKLFGDVVAIVTGVENSPPTWEAPPIRAGRFMLPLHPGRYRIDVRGYGSRVDQRPQSEGRLYFASAVIEVEDVASITRELPLREGLRVEGQVRALNGQLGSLSLRLVPASSRQPVARPVTAAVTPAGRFSAEGLAPGRYRVELLDDAWVLDAVRFRGQLQVGFTVDIEDAVSVDQLELVVAPLTASLSGTVVGAEAGVSSHVIALLSENGAEHGPASRLALTRADNRGGYLFSKQRPGSYQLFLLRTPELADLNSRTFLDELRRDSSAGIQVTLMAGAETRMDVRIRVPKVLPDLLTVR